MGRYIGETGAGVKKIDNERLMQVAVYLSARESRLIPLAPASLHSHFAFSGKYYWSKVTPIYRERRVSD